MPWETATRWRGLAAGLAARHRRERERSCASNSRRRFASRHFISGLEITDTLNHITLRLPEAPKTFLMNPAWPRLGRDHGLVRAGDGQDYDGRIASLSGVKLAPAGFNFYSGILKARPDINCVLHVHASAGAVIGSLEEGLVIVYNQSGCAAAWRGSAITAFEGLARVDDEVPRILRDLGGRHTLIMTNHGLLSVGASVAEAFGYMRALIDAWTLQERVMATGGKLKPIPATLQEHTKA